MALVDAYVVELRTLVGEARTLLQRAEAADPFTRDDVVVAADEKLRAARALHAKLGTQLAHVGGHVETQSTANTATATMSTATMSTVPDYFAIHREFKDVLDDLSVAVDGLRVSAPSTGFTPPRHRVVSRSYAGPADSADAALDAAFMRARAAADTSLDALALLHGQGETLEHAVCGATRAGDAFRSGRATSRKIRKRADFHRLLMDVLLGLDGGLLALGIIVKIVLKIVGR